MSTLPDTGARTGFSTSDKTWIRLHLEYASPRTVLLNKDHIMSIGSTHGGERSTVTLINGMQLCVLEKFSEIENLIDLAS